MKTRRFSLISFSGRLFMAVVLNLAFVACGNNSEPTTPIKKSTGGGSGGVQKPDNSAIRNALADGVLLQFFNEQPERSSELSAVSPTAAKFSAQFRINSQRVPISWKRPFVIKKGEKLDFVKAVEDIDLHDDKLTLSVAATRIDKDKSNEDMGYLVLNYRLERAQESSDSKMSYFLLLIDLNHPKNGRAVVKHEVIYPVKNDFDLKVWIDQQLKSH